MVLVLLALFSASLVMGLPVYGLVGVVLTGEDPLAGSTSLGDILVVLALGAAFNVVVVLLCVLASWLFTGRRS